MCRWGCTSTNMTFMCKWCGTWFCKQCLRGNYWGLMAEPLKCRVCFQKKCQGTRVDFVERPPPPKGDDVHSNKGNKSAGNVARNKPARSASPSSKGSAKNSPNKKNKKSDATSAKKGKKSGSRAKKKKKR